MAPTRTRGGRRRGPLTRARALERAVAIADREGIAKLSMRRLARDLGVEAMSLYHHVRDKEDILDGMVDLVFAEVELPAGGTEWRTEMRGRATSLRAALVRHPWAVGLMDSRRSPGPATLRHHDAVLAQDRFATSGGATLWLGLAFVIVVVYAPSGLGGLLTRGIARLRGRRQREVAA